MWFGGRRRRNKSPPTSRATSTIPRSTFKYIYKPLEGNDEIRVLEVSHHDTKVLGQDMPILSLKHISLSTPVNYVAISYIWGTNSKSEELIVDNGIIRIQPDLKPMIRYLSETKHPRYLWIDAVCINQQDDLEKGLQVKLMGDIYYRATHVIAYIRGDNHPSYGAAYMSGKHRSYLSLYSVLENIRQAVVQENPEALVKKLDYMRFFDNNYFFRRWIIQEICLARSVIIHCDGNDLSIGRLNQYFQMIGSKHKHSSSHAAKICTYWRGMADATSKLENLLHNHEQAICTNRLDKVYALLSLSQAAKEYIPVDYNIQPIRLLISVIRTAVIYEGLDGSRVPSFAGFLNHHLEITSDEFDQGMRNSLLSEIEPIVRMFRVPMKVRGILRHRRVAAAIEDGLNQARSWLPSLRHYGSITLQLARVIDICDGIIKEAYVFGRNAFFEDGDVAKSTIIDARNLWAFSFESSDIKDTSLHEQGDLRAGMSSGVLNVDDEVWQIPRTPVALIARRTSAGYTLIARAMILRSNAWVSDNNIIPTTSDDPSNVPLDQMLAWLEEDIADPSAHDAKVLSLSAGDLLGLMKWFGMFAG